MYAIRSYYALQGVHPDLQGTGGAAQAGRLVVVAPHPGHRQVVAGEAGEPAVAQIVGGAGLAGRAQILTEPGTCGAGGAAAHHLLHGTGDKKVLRRCDRLLHRQRVAAEGLPVGRQHLADSYNFV